MLLQLFHRLSLRSRNHMGINGKCDPRIGVPQLSLRDGDGYAQLTKQRAVQMPQSMPAETRDAERRRTLDGQIVG